MAGSPLRSAVRAFGVLLLAAAAAAATVLAIAVFRPEALPSVRLALARLAPALVTAPPEPAPARGIGGVQPGEPVAALPPAPSSEPVPRAGRNVTPKGITPGPAGEGPLTRLAVPEPTKPQAPARVERLWKPVPVSAISFRTETGEVRLLGLQALAPDARCGEGAKAWPCGTMALAALRRFVRGRAIDCDVPAGAEAIPDATRCRIGKDDIAEWLVWQGWARPDGEAFAGKAAEAKAAGRGVWSAGRPSPGG